MEVPRQCRAKGMEGAKYPFLGSYELAEMLGGRPYFTQQRPSTAEDGAHRPKPSYAIWFEEGSDTWLVTEDFRLLYDLLDSHHVSARAADVCWTPWEVACR